MYVLDTNIFYTLGSYFPSRFPTIWEKINELASSETLHSVREVRREIESNCPYEHVEDWTRNNRNIFKTPTEEEMEVVGQIFKINQYQGLIKKENILKGRPVADPFIIASAKVHSRYVVTQEAFKPKGARIPTVCRDLEVECINLERFFELENLKY